MESNPFNKIEEIQRKLQIEAKGLTNELNKLKAENDQLRSDLVDVTADKERISAELNTFYDNFEMTDCHYYEEEECNPEECPLAEVCINRHF